MRLPSREHVPLAFALQDRIIRRTRGRAWYRAGKMVIHTSYRNAKQRRLFADAIFGRMFQTADDITLPGTWPSDNQLGGHLATGSRYTIACKSIA